MAWNELGQFNWVSSSCLLVLKSTNFTKNKPRHVCFRSSFPKISAKLGISNLWIIKLLTMVPKQLEDSQCFSFTIIFLLDYGISEISYGKKSLIKIVCCLWFIYKIAMLHIMIKQVLYI